MYQHARLKYPDVMKIIYIRHLRRSIVCGKLTIFRDEYILKFTWDNWLDYCHYTLFIQKHYVDAVWVRFDQWKKYPLRTHLSLNGVHRLGFWVICRAFRLMALNIFRYKSGIKTNLWYFLLSINHLTSIFLMSSPYL